MPNHSTLAVNWQPVPCAFCGGTDTRFFYHEGWDWPTAYVRCRGCGLIYLFPRPQLSADVLRHLYDGPGTLLESYTVDPTFSPEVIHDTHYRRYADSFAAIQAAHPKPGVLLDIGTGNGLLMILAQRQGWQAIGVDVSDQRARVCRDNFKLDVRTGTLESIQLPAESVDAVSLRHLLEHVEDPAKLLLAVKRVLRTGGIALVEIPNPYSVERMVRRLLERWHLRRPKWKAGRLPMHLFEFPSACLANKATALGFTVLRRCSYTHNKNPVVRLALGAYHYFGLGTKTRLVLQKT